MDFVLNRVRVQKHQRHHPTQPSVKNYYPPTPPSPEVKHITNVACFGVPNAMCWLFLQTSCVSFDSANTNAIAGKLKEFNGNLEEVSKVLCADVFNSHCPNIQIEILLTYWHTFRFMLFVRIQCLSTPCRLVVDFIIIVSCLLDYEIIMYCKKNILFDQACLGLYRISAVSLCCKLLQG